jgi:hypothetical protein
LIFDRLEGLKGNKRVRYTKETVARGQFTLAFTADEKARFVQEHAPPIVSEQHPQEAALKPEIMAALRRYSPKQTPLRVMTASADWFVEMSPLHGRPVERRLLAYVVHRDAKGICHLSGMYYGQAFVGNGYSKRLERSAGSTDSKPFPCEAPLKRRAP